MDESAFFSLLYDSSEYQKGEINENEKSDPNSTSYCAQYLSTKLLFGLKNDATKLQRAMHTILVPWKGKQLVKYLKCFMFSGISARTQHKCEINTHITAEIVDSL